ncbi:Calcipressin [Mucor mucedo]|nr:Calcipressin [Mucor mucedo]KAI7896907.1 Calcipressin [Mucor mucedo]
MIVFQETEHAVKAKSSLDKHYIIWKERKPFPEIVTITNEKDEETWQDYEILELRVYYGQHFSIHVDPALNSLQVPQFERNLLISPPGSPFDGWEQIAEDPPNQAILGSDLICAAEVSDYELDEDEIKLDHRPELPAKKPSSKFSIVCAQGTEHPEHLPSITVQDWDGHITVELDGEEEDLKVLKRNQKKMTAADVVPTAMPPRRS